MKYTLFFCVSVLLIIGGVAATLLPFYLTFQDISQSTAAPQPADLAGGISASMPWMVFGVMGILCGCSLACLTFILWFLNTNKTKK